LDEDRKGGLVSHGYIIEGIQTKTTLLLCYLELPERDKVKCNTDGACRGNLGNSALAFCVRDDVGDLIYATARGIGIATNTEAKAMAIKEALRFCQSFNLKGVTIETDSLTLKMMIEREWKVPWELIEIIEAIRVQLQFLQGIIKHIF